MRIPGKNCSLYHYGFHSDKPVFLPSVSAYFDVKDGDWYYEAVTSLAEKGVMEGFEDDLFHPGMYVTAAEFLRLACLSAYPDFAVSGDEHWAYKYYKAALDTGAVCSGDISANQLGQRINRYNAALILSRVLEMLGEDVKVPDGIEECITDYKNIPPYYRSHVQRVYAAGIIGGYSDGSFSGEGGITRAEAAQMFLRLIDKEKRLKIDLEEYPVKVGTMVRRRHVYRRLTDPRTVPSAD